MPTLDGVTESMPEIQYHSLAIIEFVVFNNAALYIYAGMNYFVHYLMNVV